MSVSRTSEKIPDLAALKRDVPGFVSEFLSRNEDVVAPHDQALLRAMKLLIAGCGSVGGAVVEPLVRMGAGAFVLADPEAYDVSNLNRQACLYEDVGQPKANVLAKRARAINPMVDVTTLCEGLTQANLRSALEGVTVAFDGVDGFTAPWVKYLLHKYAAERRIPVLAGADLGGTAVLYLFDYRQDPRPFYGKASAASHRNAQTVEAMRWLGYMPFPTDFLHVLQDRMRTGRPWPQVAYCVSAMGALGAHTIVDVAMGRPVKHVVRMDVHMASRPHAERLREALRFPLEAARTLWAVRGPGASGVMAQRPPAREPSWEALRPVFEAIRSAPSAHNTQPWLLVPLAGDRFRLELDRERELAVADPDHAGALFSLGCAIEAAATVTRVEYEPGPDCAIEDPRWHAGQLRVLGPAANYYQAAGLVAHRHTNRSPFLNVPVAASVGAQLTRCVSGLPVEVTLLCDTAARRRVGECARQAASRMLNDEAYLAELFSWIRVSQREFDWDADGFTAEGLGLHPVVAQALRMGKHNAGARRMAIKLGMPAQMAHAVAASLEACGALVLITSADASPAGRLAHGRAMLRVWLAATHANLAAQPVDFPLAVPETRSHVFSIFGAAPRANATLLRIGTATRCVASGRAPRLPLERIVQAGGVR